MTLCPRVPRTWFGQQRACSWAAGPKGGTTISSVRFPALPRVVSSRRRGCKARFEGGVSDQFVDVACSVGRGGRQLKAIGRNDS